MTGHDLIELGFKKNKISNYGKSKTELVKQCYYTFNSRPIHLVTEYGGGDNDIYSVEFFENRSFSFRDRDHLASFLSLLKAAKK